jgi:(2Fe-2S) ferredoxin
MSQAVVQSTPFGLVGEFLGFVSTKYPQPRAIKLRWLDQEIVVKIAKDLRGDRELSTWIPGMQVQVWGTQRFSEKRSRVKFKAHRLLPWKADLGDALTPSDALIRLANPTIAETPIVAAISKPIVLKVCTKSDCRARGGQELCSILNREVIKGSWEHPVTIREIGCIGKCKSGPHLVVSPDKVTYSNPKAHDIPAILNRHLQHST